MTDAAQLRALAFAARAASGCSDVLGDALVSVILHGSLALDAFMPGRSDIDLLVVADEPLDDERLAALRDQLVEFSIARAHGRSIVGRAPEAVIGPVPDDWLIEVGDRQLAAWQHLTDDTDHAELMVLTACRIWRFGRSASAAPSRQPAAGRSSAIPHSARSRKPCVSAPATPPRRSRRQASRAFSPSSARS